MQGSTDGGGSAQLSDKVIDTGIHFHPSLNNADRWVANSQTHVPISFVFAVLILIDRSIT